MKSLENSDECMPAYKPSPLDSVESEEVRVWWVEAHSATRLRDVQ